MTKTTSPFVATCAAIDLPTEGEVPEWVHLLPAAQGEIRTYDGRGPYRVLDPAAIIAASMAADPRDKNGLIIDENHAVDIAAGQGGPSPSRGKIVAMESRADGIWGRVKWNSAGHALLADQAYRGISPVIMHDAAGVVSRILRASLVNYANLRGLAALNQENSMTFMAQLAEKLGLAADASEADVLAALPKAGDTAALQASIAEIGAALGVTGGDHFAILAAAKAKPEAQTNDLVAMQAELTTLTSAHNALQAQIKREKAEAFVDRAIAEARPGVKPRRDYYITRHMEDPAETEKTINAIPSFGPRPASDPAPRDIKPENDLTALSAEQQGRVLHDRAVAYQAEQKVKGLTVPLFDAITHVQKEVLL